MSLSVIRIRTIAKGSRKSFSAVYAICLPRNLFPEVQALLQDPLMAVMQSPTVGIIHAAFLSRPLLESEPWLQGSQAPHVGAHLAWALGKFSKTHLGGSF